MSAPTEPTEQPLHPTPMNHPMMKGKMTVDVSNKPTFQGIWGMTHADVNKGGYTNDFKVVRMSSVRIEEDAPVFAGDYQGYFKLATTNNLIETVPENFSLRFVPHSNKGHNIYGSGSNKYGAYDIVGTCTQSGKMEIFKLPEGADIVASQPAAAAAATPRTKAPPKKPKSSAKRPATTPDNKFGMPGLHVKTMKDALLSLKKSDKKMVFQYPVPSHFRGQKGLYSDIIKNPMDLGTVMYNIDNKYRNVQDCIDDIRLVFKNARHFNVDTDPVNALATSLSGKFEAFLGNHRDALRPPRPEAAARQGDGANEPAAPVAAPAAPAPIAPAPAPAPVVPTKPIGAGGIGKRLIPPPSAAAAPVTSSTTAVAPTAASGGAGAKIKSGSGAGGGNKVSGKKPATALSWEEQDKLAKDVNEVFRLGNEQPDNERAQARVYALWSFAKAYVSEKDRVMDDNGSSAEIRMDALNVKRQRQLRDVVNFFLQDGKNDPPPQPKAKKEPAMLGADDHRTGYGSKNNAREERGADAGVDGPRKRSRSDVSDSEDDDDEEDSPAKRSRDDSGASAFSAKAKNSSEHYGNGDMDADDSDDGANNRPAPPIVHDSSRIILESTTGQGAEISLDLDDEEDDYDEDDENVDMFGRGREGGLSGGEGSGEGDTGELDSQWTKAQEEKKEREGRERARAATEKALEEQRLRDQEMRQKARVEEGLKLSRERAAEKARVEALALEKKNREKAELEQKKEAERLAREAAQASVDLDQCRSDANLMSVMDQAVYDD